MDFPRAAMGGIFDDTEVFMHNHRAAMDAAASGAGLPGSLPAPEVEGLSRRLSGLHMGGAGDSGPATWRRAARCPLAVRRA
jgi:hypothetical protein